MLKYVTWYATCIRQYKLGIMYIRELYSHIDSTSNSSMINLPFQQ